MSTSFSTTWQHAVQISSRRRLVQLMAGGAVSILAPFLLGSEAGAGKKRKQRRRNKKHKNPQPSPDSTAPQIRADVTCSGLNVSGFIIGSDGRVAQSFTAGLTGDLVRADLTIDHFSISDGEYFLRVASLVDGHPTEQVLAMARIDDRTLPDGQSVVSFSFDPPAPVRAGTSYALVLSRAGAGEFTWRGDFNNSCSGRAFFSGGRSDPFEPSNQNDFLFTTFVRV